MCKQWHHIIPHEITDRRYKDIAGDLNVLVAILLALHLAVYNGLQDPAQRYALILGTPTPFSTPAIIGPS